MHDFQIPTDPSLRCITGLICTKCGATSDEDPQDCVGEDWMISFESLSERVEELKRKLYTLEEEVALLKHRESLRTYNEARENIRKFRTGG